MKKILFLVFIYFFSCKDFSKKQFKIDPEIKLRSTKTEVQLKGQGAIDEFVFDDCFCTKGDSGINIIHINNWGLGEQKLVITYKNKRFKTTLETWSDVGHPPNYSFDNQNLELNQDAFNIGDSIFGRINGKGIVTYEYQDLEKVGFNLKGEFLCIVQNSSYSFRDYEDELQIKWKKKKLNELLRLAHSDSARMIQIVDFNNLDLDSIPEEVRFFVNAKEIGLIGNKISYFDPKLFKNLKDLKAMMLNNNNLSHLPDNLSALENIEILDLSSNPIRDIQSVYTLRKLKELDLGLTEITELSDSVAQLENLEKLNLGVNDQLLHISNKIFDLPNLREVHLPEELKSLKVEGHNLCNLKTFWSSFELLKRNESALKSMANLSLLYVDYFYENSTQEKLEHPGNRKWLEDRVGNATIVDITHVKPSLK